jgi:hypothetical protein
MTCKTFFLVRFLRAQIEERGDALEPHLKPWP